MPLRRSDYENYDYQEFWEDNKRFYEDQSERMALRKLLKGEESRDRLFMDIGCGFGRLFNEYCMFPRIIMVDYSLNNLNNARMRVNKFLAGYKGRIPRVLYVAADVTKLPFREGSIDTILTVRVIHHVEHTGRYFDEVARILKKGGLYLLEFANKRNLKNIIRFLLGRRDISPFSTIPSQVGETIRNYHPADIYGQLSSRHFKIEKAISASNYRSGFLKKMLGNSFLLFLERVYQWILPSITLGPSIFLKGRAPGGNAGTFGRIADNAASPGAPTAAPFMDILMCPGCGDISLEAGGNEMKCRSCGRSFQHHKGIIDLRI